jgi:bacterioferritin
MAVENLDKTAVVSALNRIMELELAGVVRYTHYSLMVFGYNRIPIVGWLRAQATESLTHAQEAGEMVTHLGETPSLGIAALLDEPKFDIGDILRESLEHEEEGLGAYQELLSLVADKSVFLEEYARRLISEEEAHTGDVKKMLREPGATPPFSD